MKAAKLPPCDVCGNEQTEPGAIRFGPPREIKGLDGVWCRKIHVCVKCWKDEQ